MFGIPGFRNFGGAGGGGGTFQKALTCHSVALAGKEDLEGGGKILLPPSALQELATMEVQYPMMFELINPATGRRTHAGVLEFIAQEGVCNLPFWMMQNLMMNEGDILTVKIAALPTGSYVKLQPQSVDFLSLSNPKAMLEVELRKFSALTKGDIIQVKYGTATFQINVLETKPAEAISIVEADVQVDFEAPVGYVEPERVKPAGAGTAAGGASGVSEGTGAFRRRSTLRGDSDSEAAGGGGNSSSDDESSSSDGFVPFGGAGQKLNGKGVKTADKGKAPAGSATAAARAAKARQAAKKRNQDASSDESSSDEKFVPFGGTGYSLK